MNFNKNWEKYLPKIELPDVDYLKNIHTSAFDYYIDKMMDITNSTARKMQEKKGDLKDVTICTRFKLGTIEISISAKLPDTPPNDHSRDI